jgi:hypothetical protein
LNGNQGKRLVCGQRLMVYQQRSALLAPYVTRAIAGLESDHQSLGQGRARVLEGLDHLLDDVAAHEPVPEGYAVTTRGAPSPISQPMRPSRPPRKKIRAVLAAWAAGT